MKSIKALLFLLGIVVIFSCVRAEEIGMEEFKELGNAGVIERMEIKNKNLVFGDLKDGGRFKLKVLYIEEFASLADEWNVDVVWTSTNR